MADKENLAEFEACWAGDFVYMCGAHLRQLRAISGAMGAPLNYKPYTGDKKCKNCENQK